MGGERLTAVIGPHAFIIADLEAIEDAGDVVMMFPGEKQKNENNIDENCLNSFQMTSTAEV